MFAAPQRSIARTVRAVVAATAALFTLAFTPMASAGQPCESRELSPREVINGLSLAQRTVQALEQADVQVAVIARVGQDLARWRQRYSHIGLVYRADSGNAANGQTWRVVHKLNQCNTDRAHLYRQGLAEFFTDTPHDWESAIVRLSDPVAAQLQPILRDNKRLDDMHQPRYSMLSYPWSRKYQQSNEWVTETLAMSQVANIRNRHQAQSWLQFMGYQPDTLRLGTFKRLGARLTRANVEFDDHPSSRRFAGRIKTTTADSVLRWLESSRLGQPRMVVRLESVRYGTSRFPPSSRWYRPTPIPRSPFSDDLNN